MFFLWDIVLEGWVWVTWSTLGLWIFLSALDMWLFQVLFFAWSSSLQGCLWLSFNTWFLCLLTTWHVWGFPPVSLDQSFFLLLEICLPHPLNGPEKRNMNIGFPQIISAHWERHISPRIAKFHIFHKERLPQVPFFLQKCKSYQDYPPWKLTAKSPWNFAGPKEECSLPTNLS